MVLSDLKKKKTPALHKDRMKLSKKDFGAKYFGDDKRLEEISVELINHLEKLYKLDLSGLLPEDRICDILEETARRTSGSTMNNAKSDMVKKAMDDYIGFMPFAEFLKGSNWAWETIRVRSFSGIVREIAKLRNRTRT